MNRLIQHDLHNISIEKRLLEVLMTRDTAFDSYSDFINLDLFFAERHKLIYRAIKSLKETDPNQEIDLVLVADRLTKVGKLKEAGGDSYLTEILDSPNLLVSANLDEQIKTLEDLRLRREMSEKLSRVITALGDREADALDTLHSCVDSMVNISTGGVESQTENMNSLIKGLVEHIQHIKDHGVSFMATGFPHLDEVVMPDVGNQWVIAGRPSMGKAQPLDANIRTTSGWLKMGDLKVGDKLASVDGKPSEVTGIFDKGDRQVYRVTFSDGRSTEACLEHLWQVMYRGWDKPRVVNTARLMDMLTKVRYKNRVWIEPCAVESNNAIKLPIHPYLMGVILGDGGISQNTATITNSSDFIINKCNGLLPDGDMLSQAREGTWRFKTRKSSNQSSDVKKYLHSYGLMGCLSVEKFIHRDYLDASLADRLELIRGLIDTDGYVSKDGVVQYNTSSKRLSDDFTELMRSVGGVCKISSKIPTYDYKGENLEGARHYTHQLYHSDLTSLITLPRKKERLKNRKFERVNRLTLQSVEPTRTTKTRCISVSHSSHLYITDDHVVTHNTILAENITRHIAKTTGKAAVIFSLEMNKKDMTRRMMSAEGSIPVQALKKEVSEDNYARLFATISTTKDANIHVNDDRSITVSGIKTELARIHRQEGEIGVVMVDYLQIMKEVIEAGSDKHNKIAEVSRSLRAIAQQYNCLMILLSQVNRQCESRPDKRPHMGDLKESSAIEQDADIITMVYRQDKYEVDHKKHTNVVEVIVAKNRNGEDKTIRLNFEGQYSRFTNLVSGYENQHFGE